VDKIVSRAEELSDSGNFPLACSLVEFAYRSDPTNENIAEIRAKIYRKRGSQESSLMARNIFRSVSRDVYGHDEEDTQVINHLGRAMVDARKYAAKL